MNFNHVIKNFVPRFEHFLKVCVFLDAVLNEDQFILAVGHSSSVNGLQHECLRSSAGRATLS